MFFIILKSVLALKCYFCDYSDSCYKNREYGREKHCSTDLFGKEETDCLTMYNGTILSLPILKQIKKSFFLYLS